MEISNFKLVAVLGSSPIDWKFKALVDVTTSGMLWGKTTKQREVFKTYGGSWYFIDSGEFTPDYKIDALARVLEAEKGKDLQFCLNVN